MNLLTNYTFEEFAKEIALHGEPQYVQKQILDWVYSKRAASWDAMTNISGAKRALFSEKWVFPSLKLLSTQQSGQIITFKWQLSDGKVFDTTLELDHSGPTAFLFVQAGAAKRYLQPGEIIEQVIAIIGWLSGQGLVLNQIVFKGESLKNYPSLIKTFKVLTDPKLLNFSQKRVTLCTGSIEGIKKLGGEGIKANLSIPLHAPNQYIRNKIVSSSKKNPIDDLLDAVEEYAKATKGNVIYEYNLVRGLNDHPDKAFELANLLKKRPGTVHIVPYAPPIDKKALKDFRTVLFGGGVKNTMNSV